MHQRLKKTSIIKVMIGILTIATLACKTVTFYVATPSHISTPISATTLKVLSDNGQIVFSSDFSGQDQIYVTDGTNLKLLTDQLGEFSGYPVWSPDRTKIAFHNYDGTSQEIYMMNSDGSGLTQITKDSVLFGAPDWSPDGKLFALTCAFKGALKSDREVCVMNTDGTDQKQLTDNSAADGEANWSPDGTQIAFYSERDGNTEIYVMDSDGSNQTRLTMDPATDYPGEWSPDGKKIFCITDRDGNLEIYLMDADGTNLINLTNNPADDVRPTWSPDGSKIVFTSNRDGNYQQYLMNADGSGQTHLINTNSNDIGADWK